MLEAAFPFEHRPARIVVAGELREDAVEVDLPVAERAFDDFAGGGVNTAANNKMLGIA